jgi:hypothetical protein
VDLVKHKVLITLHFMGNYNEPPLTVPLEFPPSLSMEESLSSFTLENKYEIIFTPTTGSWAMGVAKSSLSSPMSTIVASPFDVNLNDETIMDYEFKLQRKTITPPSFPINPKWLSSSLIVNQQNELVMVLFGGIGEKDPGARTYFGYRSFNLNTMQWNDHENAQSHSIIMKSGDGGEDDDGDYQFTYVRKARWGHSATEVNNNVYLFGGFDHKSQYNDLFVFDPIEGTLESKHTTGDKPCYRALHTATYLPHLHSILIFGGANCSGGKYKMFNDLYLLDIESLSWTKIASSGNGEIDLSPCARSQHSSVLMNDNEVVMMGGINEDGHVLNDIWVLNLADYSWLLVNCKLPIDPSILEFRDFRLHPIRSACCLVAISVPNSPARNMILFSCRNGLFLIDGNRNIDANNNNNNNKEWKITTLDDTFSLSCHAVCSNKSTTIFSGGFNSLSVPSLDTTAIKVILDRNN